MHHHNLDHHFLDQYSPDEYLPSISDPWFHTLVKTLFAIETLTVQLYKIRNPSFKYQVPQDRVLTHQQMREQLLDLIEWVPTIASLYHRANFSVFIQAFIEAVMTHFHQTDDRASSLDELDDCIDDCIDDIHAYLAQQSIRRRLYLPLEKHRNHNKKINKFIDQLFDHYSKALVLRVDFSYRADFFPTMAMIKQDRDSLVQYLDKKQRDQQQRAYIGIIWRLEYGIDKRYHLHTVILFDANQVQRDIWIGKIIGEYWNTVITQGNGLHYNCNAHKDRYRECGIGKIHWDEMDKQEIFRRAALYLAKPDPLLEIARTLEAEYLDDNGDCALSDTVYNSRVFGSSQLEEPEGIQLGRPRTRS